MIASRYLRGASVFLAPGMAADCYVIVTKVLDSTTWGIASAVTTAAACLGLWQLVPLLARNMKLPGAAEGARR